MQSHNKLKKILKGLLVLSLVSFTLQIDVLAYQSIWGRGFTNPYTSVSFSLTEVLILLSSILFFFTQKRESKPIKIQNKQILIGLIIFNLLVLTSFLINPLVETGLKGHLIYKSLELILLYVLLTNKILSKKEIINVFIGIMSVQALIGIFQFINQGSLGLYFLGEPIIHGPTAQVAKFSFLNTDLIRIYGSFPHPNVFAGFLVASLTLLMQNTKKWSPKHSIAFSIQLVALLLTFSRVALLLFVPLLVLQLQKKLKNKKLLLLLTCLTVLVISLIFLSRGDLLAGVSASERTEGLKIAFQSATHHPFGVGWGQSTLYLDEASSKNLAPWEYQPVHNSLALILNELGIQGLILSLIAFACLIKHSIKTKEATSLLLTALVLISFTDHYLFTLEQGRWLFVLVLALISLNEVNQKKRKEG